MVLCYNGFMVTSINSLPYATFLTQLRGADNTALTKNTLNAASSLLGKGGYATQVLSTLQQDSNGKFNPIDTIFGGQSSTNNNGASKLLANLYNSVAAETLQAAQTFNPKSTKVASPVQSLIDNASKASTAYNKTLQQNAAEALKASQLRLSQITSLVS